MLKVIYEDNHLLVVEKPVNMPVQADASGDPDLLSEAKDYIKQKYNKPGEVYLGLVHRLDRPVGGVMVFARTSKAAARLTDAIKKRTAVKKYCAIVENTLPQYGFLTNYIVKDEQTRSARLAAEGTPGAQFASLEYAAVCSKQGRTLVDIALHTGRHHQIRAQFAGIGCPLFGDQRYNPAARPGQQIALWAYSLTVEHPTLREPMTFTSLPSGASWSAFGDEINALTNGVRCVYIDKNIVIVNKNADIACTVRDGGEDTVEARLACAFGEIYPVHRLDVPTTGLVVFARDQAAYEELSELIRDKALRKFYRAEVLGAPAKREGELLLYAVKDHEKALVSVFDEPVPGSREMRTGYRLIETHKPHDGKPASSVLELELFTGRTHQIRASLAHIGCPVIGDDKYGDRTANKAFKKGLRLTAVRLAFPSGMKTLAYLDGRSFEIAAPFDFI